MLRFPHCLDSRLTDGGKVVSLTRRPPFTPKNMLGRPTYSAISVHDPPKLLEAVPLAVGARVRHMRDGAPAHFSRAV
jgi:hypothetical protein